MSCCEPAHSSPAPTKEAFLTTKVQNFRTFLAPHCRTPELQAVLERYKSLDDVMPYLVQVAALVKAGQTAMVVDQVCDPFGPSADEAFRARVRRYVEMFADVLTT
jgi:hypothetical protein